MSLGSIRSIREVSWCLPCQIGHRKLFRIINAPFLDGANDAAFWSRVVSFLMT